MTKKFNIVINGKIQNIDFTVMGLDYVASDFLNWCMENRDNLEFLKDKAVLNSECSSVTLYIDDQKKIGRVDKLSTTRRP